MLECEYVLEVGTENERICGAPAEVIDSMLMSGVGQEGEDFITEMLKIQCVVGHWYNKPGAEVGLI